MWVALLPAQGVFGVQRADLVVSQTLKIAKAAFAQTRLQAQIGWRNSAVLRDGKRGVMGAAQVAAIDGGNAAVGQRLTRPLRLPAATLVQIDIQMALQARLRIPSSFAVAHGGDLGGLLHGQVQDGV
jgi:hypothetical protein